MKIKSKLSLKGNSLFRFGHPISDFQAIQTIPTTITGTITGTTTGFTHSPSPENLRRQGTGASKRT
ncbi:MAG TPA: hypothetical protein VMU83_17505 [Hanamia sp.]|nr:hypothetical protein [Hanamia sp.]